MGASSRPGAITIRDRKSSASAGHQAAAPAPRRSFNEAAHKLPQPLPFRELEGESDARETTLQGSDDAGDSGESQGDVLLGAGRAVLALGALGVVFGDIGTSPLYAEQVTFGFKAASHVSVAGVYGVVSLIFWSLAVVVSTKYAGVIMRAHNRGDGGIMALTALLQRSNVARGVVLVTLGIFGAGLFFGDGIITPAISVLGSLQGLKVATPAFDSLVLPVSVAVLI
ncbi:MAG: KUP/HAK/KT family potassium transporter, partial [Solirubrobacteraceae bacterium]